MHAEANDSYREMLMSAAAMKVQPIGQNISIHPTTRANQLWWMAQAYAGLVPFSAGWHLARVWPKADTWSRELAASSSSAARGRWTERVCVCATRKKGRVRARILLASLSFWSPRGQFMQSALMARQTVASTRALGARWPAAGRACSSVPLFRRTHELPGVVMMRVITASGAAISGTMLVLIRSIACYITW